MTITDKIIQIAADPFSDGFVYALSENGTLYTVNSNSDSPENAWSIVAESPLISAETKTIAVYKEQ